MRSLLFTALIFWALGSPPGEAANSAEPLRSLLDEMASVRIDPEPDPLYMKRMMKSLDPAVLGTTPSLISTYLGDLSRESERSRDAVRTLYQLESKRFLKLESRLVAMKEIPFDAIREAVERHSRNELFVLTLARIAANRHGHESVSELAPALAGIGPGTYPVEWLILAAGTAQTTDTAKLLPFFRRILEAPPVTVKLGKTRFNREEAQFLVLCALGETGEKIVAEAIDSPNPLIRRRAISLAGELIAEAAVKPLSFILKKPANPNEHVHALRSLAMILAYEKAPLIEKKLDDELAEVRAAAAAALGELARPRFQKALIRATEDPNPLVRHAAVRALGRYVEDPRTIEHLAVVARKSSPDLIRSTALGALSASPLRAATRTLENLQSEFNGDKILFPAAVAALQRQILSASRGELPPQFAIRGPDGEVLKKATHDEPGKVLIRMVEEEKRFSADRLAGLAPGLSTGDIPRLKRARQILAQAASTDVLLEEVSKINLVIRSLRARE